MTHTTTVIIFSCFLSLSCAVVAAAIPAPSLLPPPSTTTSPSMLSQHPTSEDVAAAELMVKNGNAMHLKGEVIKPADMAKAVASLGGIKYVIQNRCWQKVRVILKLQWRSSSGNQLYRAWKLYFPNFDGLLTMQGHSTSNSNSTNSTNNGSSSSSSEDNRSGDGNKDVSGKRLLLL